MFGVPNKAGAAAVLARAGLADMAEGKPSLFKADDVKRYMPSAMKTMDPDPATEEVRLKAWDVKHEHKSLLT